MTRGLPTLVAQVSLRHVRAAPFRTGLVVLGVALGVCLWVAMLSTHARLLEAFETMVGRLGGRAHLVVSGSEAGIPMELVAEVLETPGVAHAASVIEQISMPAASETPLLLLGIDVLGDPFFTELSPSASLKDGAHRTTLDPLAFVSDPYAVLVSPTLARQRNLRLGSALTLQTARGNADFFVRGFIEPGGPVASLGGQVVVLSLDALQMHFDRGTLVDRIDVALEEPIQREAVQARLQQQLSGVARVEPAEGRAKELQQSLAAFRHGLLLSGLGALIVSVFLVFNAVGVAVTRRRRETGLLRAVGLTRAGVVQLFLGEAVLFGALGGALGVGASVPVSRYVLARSLAAADRFILPLAAEPAPLDTRLWALGIASGVGVSMLAALLPSLRAGRIEPASCIAEGQAHGAARPLPRRPFALAALCAFGCVLALDHCGGRTLEAGLWSALATTLGMVALSPLAIAGFAAVLARLGLWRLGPAVELGGTYLARGGSSSAITVVALSLAMGTSVTIGTWLRSLEAGLMQWVDDGFPADLMVTSGSALLDQRHLPLSEAALEKVSHVAGVRHAYGVRSPDQYLRRDGQETTTRVQLMSLDTRAYLGAQAARGRARPVLAGPSPIARDALFVAPRALVSENLAVRLDLRVGDTLRYDTPRGPLRLTVHAIVRDFSSPEGWVLCDRRYYREHWLDPSVDQIDVLLEEGADAEVVAAAVREALKGHGALFVMDHAAFTERVREATHATFAYARAPQWLTLLVALVAVMSSMLAVAVDRTREVGLLRAVGATRSQVSTVLVSEAVLLAMVAATLGAACGALQGRVVVRALGYALAGWELPLVLPWELSCQVGAGVVTAAAAAAWPAARQLRRLSVSEALAAPR